MEKFFQASEPKNGDFEHFKNWGAEDIASAIKKEYGVKARIKGFHKLEGVNDSHTNCPLCGVVLTNAAHDCIKFITPEKTVIDWAKMKQEGKKINDKYIQDSGWKKDAQG